MKEKRIPLFNPLSDPFDVEWLDDTNTPHALHMDPIAITYFTESQSKFMIKRLTDAVMNDRKLNGINHQKELKEIKNQILVDL